MCCTSCGREIPDGQGHSCSMCYGDISYGKDGFYLEWAERQWEREEEKRQQDAIHEQYLKEMGFYEQDNNTF